MRRASIAPDAARSLLKLLKLLEKLLEVCSFGAVILSCSLAMQWEWAVNLWHQMESEAFFLVKL